MPAAYLFPADCCFEVTNLAQCYYYLILHNLFFDARRLRACFALAALSSAILVKGWSDVNVNVTYAQRRTTATASKSHLHLSRTYQTWRANERARPSVKQRSASRPLQSPHPRKPRRRKLCVAQPRNPKGNPRLTFATSRRKTRQSGLQSERSRTTPARTSCRLGKTKCAAAYQ